MANFLDIANYKFFDWFLLFVIIIFLILAYKFIKSLNKDGVVNTASAMAAGVTAIGATNNAWTNVKIDNLRGNQNLTKMSSDFDQNQSINDMQYQVNKARLQNVLNVIKNDGHFLSVENQRNEAKLDEEKENIYQQKQKIIRNKAILERKNKFQANTNNLQTVINNITQLKTNYDKLVEKETHICNKSGVADDRLPLSTRFTSEKSNFLGQMINKIAGSRDTDFTALLQELKNQNSILKNVVEFKINAAKRIEFDKAWQALIDKSKTEAKDDPRFCILLYRNEYIGSTGTFGNIFNSNKLRYSSDNYQNDIQMLKSKGDNIISENDGQLMHYLQNSDDSDINLLLQKYDDVKSHYYRLDT